MKTKTIYILWRTALLSFFLPGFIQSVSGQSRDLHFKGGNLKSERNINNGSLHKDSLRPVHYRQHYYVLLQFDQLPDAERKKELAARGILLYDYIPGHAFLAEIKDSFSVEELKGFAVGGLYRMPASFKIAERLQRNTEEYLHDADQLIAIRFFGSVSQEEISRDLVQAGATIVPTKIRPDHTLFIRAGQTATIQKIAALPYVSFIASQPMKPRALNYNNRAAHGAEALGAPSGRNLQGNGVTLGIGDDSDPYTHVDFTGRLIERFPATSATHGVHTSGSLAGGGILDPRYKGMAPQATLISQYYTDILINAPTYLNDYDMVLTSNSYTDYAIGCNSDGEYDGLANYTDAQLYSFPTLLHGFASGNDGFLTCTPFPPQFATIKSGFQCAKNVLTVGDINNFNNSANPVSSCGPTNDGRLKPEIVTGGVNVTSTFPNNTYGLETGTSMASPAAIGTLALIVERYRQLHGGSDPPAALLKALACNTANDMGNPGPDFQFGFGSLNGRAAIEAMENGQYRIGTVNNNGSQSYTLTGIPAGLQQVRIMLYWPDYPAAPFAGSALVNNLDLTVTSPDAVTHHPLILNPSPAHVNDIAVEGIDNLNNIEQVVVNNPPGGTFTITVNGTDIPTGSQNFVVTYQTIQPSVVVEYPFGNNTWVPGQPEILRWNAYGGEPNGFTIEYSADNGSTWSTISNTVPATARTYSWTTPATATNQGIIRVTRNSTTYSDVSDYDFTVLGQPVLTATNPCQGYVQLLWNTIPSATGYDIMQLKGDTMQKIANTTDTSFLLSSLNRDSSYWLSVRAVNGVSPGRRSLASNIRPSGGACALNSLDNDYSIDSLIGPFSGRLFTSSQLGNATPIEVELKNLGTIPTGTTFTLSYRVNGGAPVTEPSNAVIPAGGGALNYTFTHPFDFSAAGAYTVQVWVSYPGDPQPGNDTLTTVIHQLRNDPLTLTPSFTEGFESAAPGTYTSPTLGFVGLDRCDFLSSNSNGRARTLVNTGFARTGSGSATLDAAHPLATSTSDSLITTFNLANYSAGDQIWLDFYYLNHGTDFTLPGNQVWVRGND
ncbi:MAG TPA: S8 family serine peptidase, partial [Puia sp.]|nr:S8 family serine peptidase [Puia sp.]